MKAVEVSRDVAGLAGAVLVSAGIGMIHFPSGLIAAGVLLMLGAFLMARAG